MSNEFIKPNKQKPAIFGTIADPDEYNQNIAGQNKDSFLTIDADGNYIDGDLGDETIVSAGNGGKVGALFKTIKLRDGALINIYNNDGSFKKTITFEQATETRLGTAKIATVKDIFFSKNLLNLVTPYRMDYKSTNFLGKRVFTTSGTYIPTGPASVLIVELFGAGGGGAAGNIPIPTGQTVSSGAVPSIAPAGGGGNAGSYVRFAISMSSSDIGPLTSKSFFIEVGLGGNGGIRTSSSSSDGINGGNSSFAMINSGGNNATLLKISAQGGKGAINPIGLNMGLGAVVNYGFSPITLNTYGNFSNDVFSILCQLFGGDGGNGGFGQGSSILNGQRGYGTSNNRGYDLLGIGNDGGFGGVGKWGSQPGWNMAGAGAGGNISAYFGDNLGGIAGKGGDASGLVDQTTAQLITRGSDGKLGAGGGGAGGTNYLPSIAGKGGDGLVVIWEYR